MRLSTLVIARDVTTRETLCELVRSRGHRVEAASPAALAKAGQAASRSGGRDLLLIESGSSAGLTGSEPRSAAWITASGPPGSEAAARDLLAGADGWLHLPCDPAAFDELVSSALAHRARARVLADEEERAEHRLRELLSGTSPALQRFEGQLERVARAKQTTALILAQRGSGEEHVARALHAANACGPFHAVAAAELGRRGNAALEEHLARARGGTLFLRGITELPDACQEPLLTLLERRGAEPALDLRLVASSAEDLQLACEEGRFRANLAYRLNVLTLRVPALSERLEDLAELSAGILTRLRPRLGRALELGQSGIEALREHSWPGNLFELESWLVCAAMNAEGSTLEASHFPRPRSSIDETKEDEPVRDLVPRLHTSDTSEDPARTLRQVEEAWIRRVLIEVDGNRSRAARTLGINRTTLYNKLRQYDIA